MKYLGNDQYEISNTQTGETRVVSGSQLPNYGLTSDPRNDVEKVIDFLTFGQIKGAKKSFNKMGQPMKTIKGEEITPISKDKTFGQNLQTVGEAVNPVNLIYNFIDQLGPAMGPAGATAAAYYGVPTLIKALIPYMTYGGINRLKDQLAAKNPNAFKGADVEKSLINELTGGNKLGNVQSDVQVTVNDLLTRRMPNGYSGQNVYNAGDLNQLGQNIGKFEQGYSYGTPGNVVRTAVTDIVKSAAPETKFPYAASSFLGKIGKVPVVGNLLKNPVTWPIAGWASSKLPKATKVLLGIQ